VARSSSSLQDTQFQANLPSRHRAGAIWRAVFQASTIVGIIALTALLYSVIRNSFGYAAIQYSMDPEELVLSVEEERMLSAPNVVSSEDDTLLAEAIAASPNAIGFFGYAYYQERADRLRALEVDGVVPSAATVDSGEYGLARPLFVYSTAEIMREKPQVAAFLDYYLTHVNQEIGRMGYFPASQDSLDQALLNVPMVTGGMPTGDILAAGSSTVSPLSEWMAVRFREEGFAGDIAVENIGSTAGFRRFCVDGDTDMADASRPIRPTEVALCQEIGREPIEFRVGTDALVIVVSQDNSFLREVTADQLRQIFGTAELWSEVDPGWPDEPIARFIPGADSGTLDFLAEQIFDQKLEDLSKETLVEIFQANVSNGLFRRYDSEQPFEERTKESLLELVLERVVEPQVVRTWPLNESLLRRDEILIEAEGKYPGSRVEFVSWLKPEFVASPQSSVPERAGVRTAILGSLWTVAITILFAWPLGVGAAIYLEEYATDNWINRIIRTNINNLAGVPSIIYGMLGLAIFVRLLEPLSSGALFGAVDPTTANGRTVFSAGLTLGLLILPLLIINAQEAIRAVPSSMRQAGLALGATKWQTIWHHVLPSALPGILTGTILSISRAVGETAPLVVVGASTFITADPSGPFSKFTTLPIQIYQWTARPQDEFRNIAAAAIIVLLILLLTLNASAVLLRNRYSRRI
jgi:phosphate transport system permease protein